MSAFLNIEQTIELSLDQVLWHFKQGNTVVLFKYNGTYILNSKFITIDQFNDLMTSGNGRVLIN